MSEQIASITLRADVSDLKTANTELDKLADTAASAAAGADKLADSAKRVKPATQQGTEGLKEQQNALKGLLENIDPVTKALNRLDEQQASLRGFQTKGLLGSDDFQTYNKILEDTRLKLTDTGEAAARLQAELTATQAAEKQSAALKQLIANIDPTIGKLQLLDERFQELQGHLSAGRISSEQFEHLSGILIQTEQRLTDTGEAAARMQAELVATQAAERQSVALKGLLGSIDPTIRAFNMLDEQYSQLVSHFESGRINGAQFEHFNGILNETRQRLTTVADVLPEALSKQQLAAQKAGISIGQYNQALRTLPAQFTDIATQLAGGQSPFLILLQQGGQIKDQFGSVGGAISGMGEYIRSLAGMIGPTTIALGALAGTVGLLATAAYSSAEQFDNVARSIIMMGGAGFASMQQLNEAAERVADQTNTSVSSTIDTLVTLNDTGKYAADQMKQIATSITLMGKAGSDTKAAMSDFGKIVSDPVKGLASLNEQYGFVDEAMMKHIISLKKQKGEEAAVTEAIKLFSGVMAERAEEANKATDNIGNSWEWLKKTASDVFSGIGITVRAWGNQVIDIFDLVKASINDLFLNITSLDAKFTGTIAGWSEKIPGGGALAKFLNMDVESMKKAGEEADKEIEANKKRYDALWKRITDPNAQANYEEDARGAGVSGSGGTSRGSRNAVSKLADDSTHKAKVARESKVTLDAGDRTLENYRTQFRTLSDTLGILRATGETQVKNTEFSKMQSRFAELDESAKTRALTSQEKSLLSSREAILNAAKLVDQKNKEVEAQQKFNGLAQQATKFAEQQAAKRKEITAAAEGLSTREAERLSTLQRITDAYADNLAAQKDALAQQRETYQAEDELRSNWIAGARRGWADYVDEATNAYDAVKNVAGSTLTGLSDMLTSLMTTGAASVKDFGKSMLKMIVEVTNRLLVAYAVQQAMGWLSGGAGGGSTPSGAYNNAAAGVSFDSGGYTGYGGKYEPAGIVHKDEFVFTKEATNRLGIDNLYRLMNGGSLPAYASGGLVGTRRGDSSATSSGINVDIYVDNRGNSTSTVSGGSDGDAAARALAETIKQYVTEGIIKAVKDGGVISQGFAKK